MEKILKFTPKYFGVNECAFSKPAYLMLNLDTRCSYACKKCALTCGRKDIRSKLTLNQQKIIIKQAKELGVKALVIIGNGEPTENFSTMKDVVGYAYRQGIGSIIFTNGSSLDEEQAKFYEQNDATLIFSLDAIDEERYFFLTGSKKFKSVMKNIEYARSIFKSEIVDSKKIVRLGINVTVVNQNVDRLMMLKEFAGDDMFFGANPPMKLGNIKARVIWEKLVGNNLDNLERAAYSMSDAHGPSSIQNNVCMYFFGSIAVDVDGQLMTCGYASQTAGLLGNALDGKAAMLRSFEIKRQAYRMFAAGKIRKPCPVRDNFDEFVERLQRRKRL